MGSDGPRARARVAELAATDPEAALEVARAIVDPWYRCQSLATVAEHVAESNERLRMRILGCAFDSAGEIDVPNRTVTVASWPLGILARSPSVGEERVVSELRRLLAIIEGEPHPIRRMDGQAALFTAVLERGARTADLALGPLLDTIRHAHGWKRDRMVCFVAAHLMMRGESTRAWALLDTCELPRETRRARKYFESRFGPRGS